LTIGPILITKGIGGRKMRVEGRNPEDIRAVTIHRNYIKHAEGSVLIEMGDTRVICTASVVDKVPLFLKGSGTGWITAEYSMLPRATPERGVREATQGRMQGRTQEIRRLIGRSLRAVADLTAFGERCIWIDCDVIQADGGTRTAAVTGGFVALVDAFTKLESQGIVSEIPLLDSIAAVSIGLVDGEILLDLNYREDSLASVDVNFVMTGGGKFVEIQGTAERDPFSKKTFDIMLQMATKGIKELTQIQREALGGVGFK
jgi:ribonuclease PH